MENYFVIRIDSAESNYSQISEMLDLKASSTLNYWEYQIEYDSDSISFFHNLLIDRIKLLNIIGIENDDISLWLFYEYENQCNIELSPNELRLLSELKISFCFSCWEKNQKFN